MYPEASLLGISYESYWDMYPIEVFEIAKAKQKEFIDNANYQLSVAWYGASLQGIAMNDPKKFPKQPPKIETEQDKADKDMLLAYKLEAMFSSGKFSK